MEGLIVLELLLICLLKNDIQVSGSSINPSSMSDVHQSSTPLSVTTWSSTQTPLFDSTMSEPDKVMTSNLASMRSQTTMSLMTSFHSPTLSVVTITMNSTTTPDLPTMSVSSLNSQYNDTSSLANFRMNNEPITGSFSMPLTTDGSLIMSTSVTNALSPADVSTLTSDDRTVLTTSFLSIVSTLSMDSSPAIEDISTFSLITPSPSASTEIEGSTGESSSTAISTDTTSPGYTTEAVGSYTEFKRPMLLLGVGLTCGLGGMLALFIILHGYQRNARTQTLSITKGNSQSDETLETCTITPLGSEIMDGPPESVVDMNRVETVSIHIHPPTPPPLPPLLPPPPPPPPKFSETDDFENHDYFILEPQREPPDNSVAENFANKRWSYHEGGDMLMKTFKGSKRMKPKSKSWISDGTGPKYLTNGSSGSINEALI